MRNNIYSLMNELTNMFNYDGGYKSFPIDVVEVKNGYKVYAEMPGVSKENIHISFEDGELTIEADPISYKDITYLIHERNSMKLKRVIRFGEIYEDGLSAKFDNGILEVLIQVKEPEEKKAKVIPIE